MLMNITQRLIDHVSYIYVNGNDAHPLLGHPLWKPRPLSAVDDQKRKTSNEWNIPLTSKKEKKKK